MTQQVQSAYDQFDLNLLMAHRRAGEDHGEDERAMRALLAAGAMKMQGKGLERPGVER